MNHEEGEKGVLIVKTNKNWKEDWRDRENNYNKRKRKRWRGRKKKKNGRRRENE
jgi:hypothetical protein